jgi:hypothetical protein
MATTPLKSKRPPALKHGAFAKTTVLPGEDAAAFARLREDLMTELSPSGALEEAIAEDLARLIWRKRHLGTFHTAKLARRRLDAIQENLKPPNLPESYLREQRERQDKAWEQAREELGHGYQLLLMGDAATLEHHTDQLLIEERMDAMIDRTLKRLLFVRGLKSMSLSTSTPKKASSALLPVAESKS